MSHQSVKVVKGNGGWGDDMILTPTPKRKSDIRGTAAASTR